MNFRISRDYFASLAMTKILEFPKPCVIPRPLRGISSQNRDPPVKLRDDIVGNSKIPKLKNTP